MTELSDEEFKSLLEGIDYRQGGQGDSPYSQKFVDELYGRGKKKDKKKQKGDKKK